MSLAWEGEFLDLTCDLSCRIWSWGASQPMPQQQLRWHNWPLCPAHPLISLATSANDDTICPMEVTEALGVENSSHTTEMLWESHRWGSSWWYLPQGAMRGILDWEVDASGSNSDLSVLRAKVSYAVPVKLSCANAQSGLLILLGFSTFSIPSYLVFWANCYVLPLGSNEGLSLCFPLGE